MCSADSMKKAIPYPNFISMPFIFIYWIHLGFKFLLFVVVVQWVSHVQLFVNPWSAASQAALSFTICQSLFRFMCIESGMLSKHFILCRPLFVCLQSFPAPVFPNEWALCTRWTQYGSFSFSISPSNEYSGLVSFRSDWFDLAVQGTLTSLLQHHNSKASTLRCSAFLMVQLSHLYMTTGKTIVLMVYRPLSAKWCFCFLIHCLGLS